MILENFKHNVAKSCRTVAIRDLLERNSLNVREEFVFGLAGGLSFSFVKPEGIKSENRYFKVMAPNLFQFENFAQNAEVEYQKISQADTDFHKIEEMLRLEDNLMICEVSPMVYANYLGSNATMWKDFKMDLPLPNKYPPA